VKKGISMPSSRISKHDFRRARRGFTLVELLVAGLITAFVVGSIGFSLRQIGRSKDTCKVRYDAHMRADAALSNIRRDIASIVRSDDLFYTRFLLINNQIHGRDESYDRDELLIFSDRLRPLRNIEFTGEGLEYETQYRVEEDKYGPVLWQRRDAFPDQYPGGGGVATPAVEGILALSIQAYDGTQWYDDWDSDYDGLPVAVRISVVASGNRGEKDVYTAPRAILRTVVAIDRALSSKDWFITPEADQGTASQDTDNGNGNANGNGAGNGAAGGGGGSIIGGTPGGPGGQGGRPGGPPRGGDGGRPAGPPPPNLPKDIPPPPGGPM
jgi:type II secretion system protein J